MPTHWEILEEEYAMDDHVVDVLPICQYIFAVGRDIISI